LALIFLSYARPDRSRAMGIRDALDRAGHEVWMDAHSIDVGEPFPNRIGEGTQLADYFLLLLTQEALQSGWMRFELQMFLANGDISTRANAVIPMVADAVSVRDFSPLIGALQAVDQRQPDWLERLQDRLQGGGKKATIRRAEAERLSFAIDLARRAGSIVMNYYNSAMMKAQAIDDRKNTATTADQIAQQNLVSAVLGHPQFRADTIVGEEDVYRAGTPVVNGYTWVFDPLDGTTNFLNRIPFFCSAVGVLRDRKPHIGVVYDPINDLVYYALEGTPSRVWNVATGEVSKLSTRLAGAVQRHDEDGTASGDLLAECVAGTHISTRPGPADRMFKQGLLQRVGKGVKTLRALGCGQLSLAYVASGRLQLFFQLDSYLWDQVAGVVLVRNAGGSVRELHEETEWSWKTKDLVAGASAEVTSRFLELVEKRRPIVVRAGQMKVASGIKNVMPVSLRSARRRRDTKMRGRQPRN
jgi:myo-inositol-1(or 4)-monophosphatase